MPCREGELRRRVAGGCSALYRVVALHGDMVHVSVVRVPGFAEGLIFRFTRQAVEAMERVEERETVDEALAALLAA